MLLRRGDIVLTDFTPARIGEVNYIRPAIVVSNNNVNAFSSIVMVTPLTSNINKIYGFEIFLPLNRTNLDRDSKAQIQLTRHVHINRITKTLGFIPEDLIYELDNRLREHLAL